MNKQNIFKDIVFLFFVFFLRIFLSFGTHLMAKIYVLDQCSYVGTNTSILVNIIVNKEKNNNDKRHYTYILHSAWCNPLKVIKPDTFPIHQQLTTPVNFCI